MEPLTTIGIDPGKESGVVALIDCNIVHASAVTSSATDPWTKIEALKRTIKTLEVPVSGTGRVLGSRVVVSLETQYLGKNAHSMIQIVKSAAAWEVVAIQLGCQIVEGVAPTTWQALLGLAKGERAWRARQLKRALAEVDMQGASPDVQSAVMIAICAQMRRIGWGGDPDRGVDGFGWVLEARRARKMEIQARKTAKRRKRRTKNVAH